MKEARRLLEGFSKAAVDDDSIATPPPATDDEASDVGTSISYQDSNARLYCYISEIHCRLRHHNTWAYQNLVIHLQTTSLLLTKPPTMTYYPISRLYGGGGGIWVLGRRHYQRQLLFTSVTIDFDQYDYATNNKHMQQLTKI